MRCLFVSDLHGSLSKYQKLFDFVEKNKPKAVFFGGDLLPMIVPSTVTDMKMFIQKTILEPMNHLKQDNQDIQFFLILGNDDPRCFEPIFQQADNDEILEYVHQKTTAFKDFFVTGYSYVPPTPFQLKDWERYDVSRFVDVGTISPEDGTRTVPVELNEIRYATIQRDLQILATNAPIEKTIFLFHSPPYNTVLDHADLDGKTIDHAPVDVHIGSIAIRRFIERYHPFLTLHGHVHESFDLTGDWKQHWEKTVSFSAASTDNELAIVSFDTDYLQKATRILLPL